MNFSAEELRDWAARCAAMAGAALEEERIILLRKAEALLALAETEDWLSGRPIRAENPAE